MGPEGTVTFGYDSTNQLTSASRSMPESYGYDNNGNRNTGSYSTAAGNRLTFDGTYTYTYDNEGNVLSKTGTNGGAATPTRALLHPFPRVHYSPGGLRTKAQTFTHALL